MLLGTYETFKLENSLIGAVYPTSPHIDSEFESELQAKHAMIQSVSNRGKYFYNYSEYCFSRFLRYLCCCCRDRKWLTKRVKKLERHEAASKKLAEEIDIV